MSEDGRKGRITLKMQERFSSNTGISDQSRAAAITAVADYDNDCVFLTWIIIIIIVPIISRYYYFTVNCIIVYFPWLCGERGVLVSSCTPLWGWFGWEGSVVLACRKLVRLELYFGLARIGFTRVMWTGLVQLKHSGFPAMPQYHHMSYANACKLPLSETYGIPCLTFTGRKNEQKLISLFLTIKYFLGSSCLLNIHQIPHPFVVRTNKGDWLYFQFESCLNPGPI